MSGRVAHDRVRPRAIVERSTTGTNLVDGVETGWTERHFLPLLERSSDPRIVNVSSALGSFG